MEYILRYRDTGCQGPGRPWRFYYVLLNESETAYPVTYIRIQTLPVLELSLNCTGP